MHRTIKAYRLLIIDEPGTGQPVLPGDRRLYEKGSVIVTSNLSFGQWDTTFAQCEFAGAWNHPFAAR